MKQFNTHLATLFCLALASTMTGQISFNNQSTLLQNQTVTSGVAVGIADMNGDGLDDVVRLNDGNNLSIEYQAAPGQPFANYTHGNVPGNAWAMSLGDVNNDGYCDIFVGGSYDGVKVLSAQNGGASYQQKMLGGAGVFVQGSNFADINNDGHLDVFSCHDDGESRIWGNDGTGNFILADEWIDMATTPASDNSGNYGSVWTDFDNDGDLDLYIAKCRQGVDDPSDPRRINALFQNDGQNNYSEVAGKYGLKIDWQSWTADFQDIDNDGDMDCLVTNHDYNLQLLENDGAGRFTDISQSAGVAVSGGFIQGIMRDFDNDGFMDIITLQPLHLFRNNHDKTFTEVNGGFGGGFGSLATGDLNHDGYIDILGSYMTGFNGSSNIPDKVWMNNGGTNHYLAVTLKGNQSNRLGVGTRLEIHGAWGIQVREIRSGESYGINNSLNAYFGIGEETEIEYLVVRWPSGVVDVVKNPAIDTYLTVEEGTSCAMADIEIGTSGSTILCPGETVELTAPAGFDYLWNNGFVGQSITVEQAGNYRVVLVDAQGCLAESNVVVVTESPDETPSLVADGDTEFCEGGLVTLTSSPANAYIWSNGETSQSITIAQTGDYSVVITGECAEFSSEPIHVEVHETPDVPTADGTTIFFPATVTLNAVGNNVLWYMEAVGGEPVFEGNIFETPVITETTTYYIEDANQFGGGEFQTGMPAHQGSQFNGDSFNGQLLFDVSETLKLKSVTVYTDTQGPRLIELLDDNNNVLQSITAEIPVGQSVATLDFVIEPGTGYKLATNGAFNESTLGTLSPRLRRSDQGVQFPYTVPDAITITNSNYGAGFYYYFYNWEVEVEGSVCASDRLPVVVELGTSATKEAASFGKLAAMPNPSNGVFQLELIVGQSGPAQLTVLDLTGRPVFQDQFLVVGNERQLRTIHLGGVPSGVYFLQVRNGEKAGYLKLIVE